MKTIISGIYAIVNNHNGHRYIGSAVDVLSRWNVHKHHLRNGKHHSVHLQRAWEKYGEDCFEFSILERCDKSLLIQREQIYMDVMRPEYNTQAKAGSNLGTKHTDASRKKMSESRKGRIISKEWGKKISEALKGRVFSIEWRKKIGDANRSRIVTWGAKIAEKNRARVVSQETRQKISISMTGKRAGEKHPLFGKPGNKYHKFNKSVSQFTKSGEPISTFISIRDAERGTGVSRRCIQFCCKGETKTAGGFIWRYADE